MPPTTTITTAAQAIRPTKSIKQANFFRAFHDYFVTHLPSSSLHPDSRSSSGPGHQLPRSASKPHDSKSGPSPAPLLGHQASRDTTVVRIPLRSAKHHFGVSVSRGTRPYNEDAYQAGVIELPAFAKRAPLTLSRAPKDSPLVAYREAQRREREQQDKKARNDGTNSTTDGEGQGAEGASGDPQVFYFGVFDGHGGADCSGYLTEKLHQKIEETAKLFDLKSTLNQPQISQGSGVHPAISQDLSSSSPDSSSESSPLIDRLITPLLKSYKENIGGYFKRFTPQPLSPPASPPTILTILAHAFLSTDLSFLLTQLRLAAQQNQPTSPSSSSTDRPINDHDSSHPTPSSPFPQTHIPTAPFRGGSTASIALISTPTPTPFWHPSTTATLTTAHVGDTRILLSRVSDGAPVALTTNHHASNPRESSRLRRFAAGSMITDSFGEERLSGLANTRAFGDMGSKSLGVSAEPECSTTHIAASEYAFMVIVSDGISGVMSDQEIIDTVKEARTPELAARELVAFATDVGASEGGEEGADNATGLVVRMGGGSEGGRVDGGVWARGRGGGGGDGRRGRGGGG
ncbi:MAG: Protein phosphatase 2C 6 [Ramalina farinacea]|uniref:Protein phosphatase 2C 6 n=1 Tax=Ramalina farinacea TaxID=258253 RepID=A0AA43QJI0_9LECA|nr:Protein phosphatase 2C 6 [Ramalina farinacea]